MDMRGSMSRRQRRDKIFMAARSGVAVALAALTTGRLMGFVSTSAYTVGRGSDVVRSPSPVGHAARFAFQAANPPVQVFREEAALLKFASCGFLLCLSWRRAASLRQRSRALCRVVSSNKDFQGGLVSVSTAGAFSPSAVSQQAASVNRVPALPPVAPFEFRADSLMPSLAPTPNVLPGLTIPNASFTRRCRAARFVAGARHCTPSRTPARSAARAAAAASRAERRAHGAQILGSACIDSGREHRSYDVSTLRTQIQRGLRDMRRSRSERGGREPKASASIGCGTFTQVSMRVGIRGRKRFR